MTESDAGNKEISLKTKCGIELEKQFNYEINGLENIEEDDDKAILPNVKKGQTVNTMQIDGIEIFQRPKSLFTEATLLKELEIIGVGRPSTIATISKILTTRLYIDKKDLPAKKRDVCNLQLKNNKVEEEIRTENFAKETGKLIPTDLGMIVCDFLLKNFPDIMNPNYTSKLEELLDLIASGKEDFKKVLTEFNTLFQENLKKAKGSTEKPGSRLIGIDPKTGKSVYARLGRFGAMVQLGEAVKQEKPKKGEKPAEEAKSDVKFGKIPEGKSIETITLKEALEILAWPKHLGEHKGKEIAANTGKFGPYVRWNEKFYSITQDPAEITLEEAIEAIKIKEAGGGGKAAIKEFEKGELKVLDGKFGPYISYKKKNYKIPSHYTPADLTKEECLSIVGDAKAAPKKKSWGKKKK